ncbi:MAG: FHA domain-containing protein [Gammaproteobacteria bacterium]|nr:FHA domain-containing protein [Gammaproteobacteria bacterium]MBU1731936.1 FHA domain-containing protein [Gammaproteobacteria bacterium]MBU1893074.1 FHA domain-containing protein [Gammaproteobacteria bacterium]
MSKLVLQGERGPAKEFALDHERVTIGRKANSDIHLDDSAVSGNHAVIITLGSDSFLEDLESTNGTKVNQSSIHKYVLQDGDEIRIAHFTFTFVSEALEASAPGKTISATPRTEIATTPHAVALDGVTTMPGLSKLNSITNLGVPTQSDIFGSNEDNQSSSLAHGILKITTGLGAGQTLELSRPVTTLGKPGIQVAAITLRDGQYYLGLVEGSDLPLINKNEIKTLPCKLQSGDVIGIAGVELEFS